MRPNNTTRDYACEVFGSWPEARVALRYVKDERHVMAGMAWMAGFRFSDIAVGLGVSRERARQIVANSFRQAKRQRDMYFDRQSQAKKYERYEYVRNVNMAGGLVRKYRFKHGG